MPASQAISAPAAHLGERLGFYVLPGATNSPRDLIAEVRDGEQLGLGWGFVSERFGTKDAHTLCGAVGAVTDRLMIATGVTNHNTRHPLITASHASTMHLLTGGRFVLGLGRGFDRRFDAMGVGRVTNAQLEDFVGLMRRLWKGEAVIGHRGPIGSFPALRLDPAFDFDIPIALAAFGPNALALGGRCFDHVILHTFFTDDTLVRCVATVREAAERADRDPASVKVWSCLATIGDHLPEAAVLKKTVGRMATYLQAYGDLMIATNRWDPAALANFRADPWVARQTTAIDDTATPEELRRVATLIPTEWLEPAAIGTPKQCRAAVLRQFELGADGVILHGASPADLAPIVRTLLP